MLKAQAIARIGEQRGVWDILTLQKFRYQGDILQVSQSTAHFIKNTLCLWFPHFYFLHP